MRTIEYLNKNIDVPESLEELTPGQYYRYLEIAMLANRNILVEQQARLKLMTLFLDLPVDVSMLPTREISEILSHLSITEPFILKEKKNFRLDLQTGINLLPAWERWRGPDDMLNGVSFETFCKCMALIKQFGNEDNENDVDLQQFGSLLYSDGIGTQPPMLVCLHAYLFFLNVFTIIQKEPLELDGETVDFRILFDKAQDKRKLDDHTGWAGIGMDIAETGTFGNLKQVKETPFWDILLFLYKKKFEKLHSKK